MHPDERGPLSSFHLLAVWPVAGAWALLCGGLGGASSEGGLPLRRAQGPWGFPVSSARSLGAGLEEVGSKPRLLACAEAASPG